MPERTPREFTDEWQRLKATPLAGDDAIAALERLLRECIESGTEVIEPAPRAELQTVAREVAEKLFELTGRFPEAIIRRPSQFLSPSDDWVPLPDVPPPVTPPGQHWAVAAVGVLLVLLFAAVGWINVAEVRKENLEAQRAAAVGDASAARQAQGKLDSSHKQAVQEKDAAVKNATAAQKQAEEAARKADGRVAEIEKRLEAGEKEAKQAQEYKLGRDRAQAASVGLQRSMWASFEKLPPGEQEKYATQSCLDFIRACRMDSGPFAGVFRVNAGGDGVWVKPSHANLAAMALLTFHRGEERPGRADDLAAVKQWLLWYAGKQNPETGTVANFKGSRKDGSITALPEFDTDVSGKYLVAVQRYYEMTKEEPPPEIRKAARLAVKEITERLEPPGRAKGTPPQVTYLMTGVADCAGLVAGARFFSQVKDADESRGAAAAAKRVAARLRDLAQPQGFAASFSKGQFQTNLAGLSDVSANLYGLAWVIAENRVPWEAVRKGFSPGDEVAPYDFAPGAPVELWYAAASRIGADDAKAWRPRVLRAAAGFAQSHTYLDRAAFTLLTLSDGAAWLPGVNEAEKLP